MAVTQGKLQRAINRVASGTITGIYAAWNHTHDTRYAPVQLSTYTSATRPAADATWVGKSIIVKDAAQPSTVEACVQNSAGGYEWLIVAQSS